MDTQFKLWKVLQLAGYINNWPHHMIISQETFYQRVKHFYTKTIPLQAILLLCDVGMYVTHAYIILLEEF